MNVVRSAVLSVIRADRRPSRDRNHPAPCWRSSIGNSIQPDQRDRVSGVPVVNIRLDGEGLKRSDRSNQLVNRAGSPQELPAVFDTEVSTFRRRLSDD